MAADLTPFTTATFNSQRFASLQVKDDLVDPIRG
jgi:hypothetical protein